MPLSQQTQGTEITAEIEHRKGDGTLIYKSGTIPEPVLPDQPIVPDKLGLKAAMGYIKEVAKWRTECNESINTFSAIQEYEELRAHYAGNRNKDIPIKYRTGEPYPKTLGDAKAEISILKKLIKEEGNGSSTSNNK